MNGLFKHMGLALVGFGAIAGLLGVSPVSAQTVQTNSNQPLPGLGNSDQRNDGMTAPDGVNVYDLIHQLQMGSIPSMSEFSQEQQRNINSAATDFRTRQMERLRQQTPQTQMPQAIPMTPAPSSQPVLNPQP
ncbi:hypothetical protein [Leptolyngbya ohadii]|uniref:hypothetical protein n=1 Tax=Leptolyngbya ohadii TaxID=1962290 RepID=UPI000B59D483|nr:hypothetical protein [Leptolyngbya ohadii]